MTDFVPFVCDVPKKDACYCHLCKQSINDIDALIEHNKTHIHQHQKANAEQANEKKS